MRNENKKSPQVAVTTSEDKKKTHLLIEAKVSSFEEGIELLEKIEILKNRYEMIISLEILLSQSFSSGNS